MTSTQALIGIFYRPRETLSALADDQLWFLAALVVGLLSCAVWFVPSVWTSSYVERASIVERNQEIRTLEHVAADSALDSPEATSDPNQSEADRVSGESVPIVIPKIRFDWEWIVYTTIRFVPITLVCVFGFLFLEASYFRLIGSFLSPDFTITDWYRLSIWSRVPATSFSVIFTVLALSTDVSEPTLHPANVFALARWIEMPDAYLHNGLFSSRTVDVGLVWVVVLQTIGIREWCATSTVTSLVITAIPVVLFYAISTLWFYTIGALW